MKIKSYLGCLTAIVGVVASSQMAIADTESLSNLIAEMPGKQMQSPALGQTKLDGHKDKNPTQPHLFHMNYPDPKQQPENTDYRQQQPENNNEDRPLPIEKRIPGSSPLSAPCSTLPCSIINK
jgi:hypothetical protein